MNAYEIALSLYAMAKAGEDGTLDADNETLPTYGYWVGGRCESLVYKDVESIDRGELAWFIGTNPSQHYGVWVNQVDKRIYFDVADHQEFRVDAEALAKLRGEIAIWGIEEDGEIRVSADQNYQDPEAAA